MDNRPDIACVVEIQISDSVSVEEQTALREKVSEILLDVFRDYDRQLNIQISSSKHPMLHKMLTKF
jgi:hypothetical protein